MKQSQGITEQLKAENALEWVERLNNVRGLCNGDCLQRNRIQIKAQRVSPKEISAIFLIQ